MSQPLEVFCCVAESDRSFLEKLRIQLAVQQSKGVIKLWDKSQIPVGRSREKEIQQHLASANIFLLLISAEFLADDYCLDRVTRVALERLEREEALSIPVIVRPVNWQHVDGLNSLEVLPRNGLPISEHPNQDSALLEVVKEINGVIESLTLKPLSPKVEDKIPSRYPSLLGMEETPLQTLVQLLNLTPTNTRQIETWLASQTPTIPPKPSESPPSVDGPELAPASDDKTQANTPAKSTPDQEGAVTPSPASDDIAPKISDPMSIPPSPIPATSAPPPDMHSKFVLSWQAAIPVPATQVAVFATPVHALLADETGNIYIYRQNGELLYKDHIEGRVFHSAVLPDRVLLGTWSGHLYCFGTRELLWQTHLESPISALAVGQGELEVVAGTWDGQIVALRTNGDLLWKIRVEDGISTIAVTQDGKQVAVSSYGGYLVLLDVQGQRLWERDMQAGVVAVAFVDGMGGLLVATRDCVVTRINIQNQGILWERNIQGTPLDLLLSGNSRRLLIPCHEGKVLIYSIDATMELRNTYTINALTQVMLSPVSRDGNFILALSQQNGLHAIDNRREVVTIESDEPASYAAISLYDGHYALIGNETGIAMYRLTRPQVQLELQIVGTLRQDRYTRLRITLSNTGERTATEIMLNLEGMIEATALHVPAELAVGSSVSTENQSIQPRANGALPIIVRLRYSDDLGINYEQTMTQTFDVL